MTYFHFRVPSGVASKIAMATDVIYLASSKLSYDIAILICSSIEEYAHLVEKCQLLGKRVALVDVQQQATHNLKSQISHEVNIPDISDFPVLYLHSPLQASAVLSSSPSNRQSSIQRIMEKIVWVSNRTAYFQKFDAIHRVLCDLCRS